MSEFPPIAHLMPHSEPMVLLDRVLDWSPGRIECATQVRENARLVEDGLLLAPFTIEHMAQAVAVCLGYEAYRGGRGVRVGMIVSCRAFAGRPQKRRIDHYAGCSVARFRLRGVAANGFEGHFLTEFSNSSVDIGAIVVRRVI